jgi:hypothetical protein
VIRSETMLKTHDYQEEIIVTDNNTKADRRLLALLIASSICVGDNVAAEIIEAAEAKRRSNPRVKAVSFTQEILSRGNLITIPVQPQALSKRARRRAKGKK